MSTLKADTLVASDGTSPVTLTKQQAAKAWVNLKATSTVGIQQSFNASSLVDESTTGQLSYSFTNNFNYVDHAGAGCVNHNEATSYSRILTPFGAPSTSGITLQQSLSTNGGQEDSESMQFINFGDLA